MKTAIVSAEFTVMFPTHSTEPDIQLGLHKHVWKKSMNEFRESVNHRKLN